MERVRDVLAEAFGSTPVGAVTAVAGGATSASLFRAELGGRPYLVRFEGEPSPLRNPYQYESLRIAAEAGIAPKLFYADAKRGIAVMDFVRGQKLRDYPGGPHDLAVAVGALLRRLQETPVFPYFVVFPTSSRACSRMCAARACSPKGFSIRIRSDSNAPAKAGHA